MSGVLSPSFLKGDLGGLLSGYLIPPLEKGGKNVVLNVIVIMKSHTTPQPREG
jgi:hypothetical protein